MSTRHVNINYTTKDLINHIERHGWVFERNSKHIIYMHPDKKHKLAVPRRVGNLSPGTARQILKRMVE